MGFHPENQIERARAERFVPPAGESLLDPASRDRTWSRALTNDPDFQEQTDLLRQVHDAVLTVCEVVPLHLSLQAAVNEGIIDPAAATTFFDSLSTLMSFDPAYERIILYIPFEFLRVESDEPALQAAVTRFRDQYHEAWQRQLTVLDVRANFVDGDVLEPELRIGDYPRVVKAAHLIPALIASGMVNVAEVLTIVEATDEPTLIESIADAMAVLYDQQLLSETDREHIQSSRHAVLRNQLQLLETVPVESVSTAPPTRLFAEILDEAAEKLQTIAAYDPEHSTPARTAWLRKDARQRAIAEAGQAGALALLSGTTNTAAFEACTTATEQLIGMSAIEHALTQEPTCFATYQPWLKELDSVTDAEVVEARTRLYRYAYDYQQLTKEDLETLGVTAPDLAQPFSENVSAMGAFLDELHGMTEALHDEPLLHDHVYPLCVLYGSRVKGYGRPDADADVAVFVRPGTPRVAMPELQKKLAQVFDHELIGGKAMLFWLDEEDDGLKVHDWPAPTAADGESTMTHVLFGGSWHGDQQAIEQLHKKLLPGYFTDPHTVTFGHSTRSLWLEELERDTIQYRLLQKGYERYHPVHSIDTPHAKAIDGQSAFWDPQFRRIATRLFVDHVFLPNLPK